MTATFFTVSYINIVVTDTKSLWQTKLILSKFMPVSAMLTEHQDPVFLTIKYINVSLTIKVYVHWFLEPSP